MTNITSLSPDDLKVYLFTLNEIEQSLTVFGVHYEVACDIREKARKDVQEAIDNIRQTLSV
jgi:hypothetical protein